MKTTTTLTISLLLLATTLVSAQHRFSIGITAAPTLAYANTTQTIYLPDTTPGSTGVIPMVFSGKTTTWGYTAGLMARYAFTPAWSVSTGFWYNRFSTDGVFPFAPGEVPTRYISRSFQVPLFINYRSSQRRLSPYFSAGALANIRQFTILRPEAGSGLSDTKLLFGKSAVTYKAVLGAGIAYKINAHLSLIVQPLLIWNFKPNGSYEHFVSYQVNGQTQLMYSF